MELKEIVAIAERAEDIQAEMAGIALQLKEKSAEYDKIIKDILPSAMAEEGLHDFTLESGTTVKIKSIIAGSLPAAGAIEKATGDKKSDLLGRLHQGLTFIRENQAGDIIKNQIIASLPAGDDELASIAVKAMQELKLNPIRVETVHPGTLNSWLKERHEMGKDIPEETFGLFTGMVAKFELPKPVKPKKS